MVSSSPMQMGSHYIPGPPRHVLGREEEHCISYEKWLFFFFSVNWSERRGNITSFADFALATTIFTVGRLEGQNLAQLCLYTLFSFVSSWCKNVFPRVSGQLQTGPAKFQFQFLNESKTRQRNSSLNKTSVLYYKINSLFFFYLFFHFSIFLACFPFSTLCIAIAKKLPFTPCLSLRRAFSWIR